MVWSFDEAVGPFIASSNASWLSTLMSLLATVLPALITRFDSDCASFGWRTTSFSRLAVGLDLGSTLAHPLVRYKCGCRVLKSCSSDVPAVLSWTILLSASPAPAVRAPAPRSFGSLSARHSVSG